MIDDNRDCEYRFEAYLSNLQETFLDKRQLFYLSDGLQSFFNMAFRFRGRLSEDDLSICVRIIDSIQSFVVCGRDKFKHLDRIDDFGFKLYYPCFEIGWNDLELSGNDCKTVEYIFSGGNPVRIKFLEKEERKRTNSLSYRIGRSLIAWG